MSARKRIPPNQPVPLKLTATERKLLLEDVTCLDLELVEPIEQTPTSKPIEFSLDDWEQLGGFVAAEANHTDNKKLQKKLDRIFEKIQNILDTYDDQPDAPGSLPDFLMRVSADPDEEPASLPIRPIRRKPKLGLKLAAHDQRGDDAEPRHKGKVPTVHRGRSGVPTRRLWRRAGLPRLLEGDPKSSA